MFKNKSKIITFLLILVLFISSTSFVFADDNDIALISADNVKQAVENEVTDQQNQEENYKKSDVYLVGDDITIDYIVDGNHFCKANKVTIKFSNWRRRFYFSKRSGCWQWRLYFQ